MFCANCGTKQNEGEKFCPNCGTKFEEPLKVEEAKVEEISKTEKPKPEDVVPVKMDDKVQIEAQTTKEEKSFSVQNEDYASIIETHSTKDKGVKVEIIEQSKNRSVEEKNIDDAKKELNVLILEAENNNIEAQMRLAVKYEFGLGVAVDVDKAQLLYSKIKENIELKSLIPSDINVRTGVVSDSYNIEIISLYHNTRGVDKAFSPD